MKLTCAIFVLTLTLLLGSRSDVVSSDVNDFQATEDGRETYTIPIKVVNETGCCVRLMYPGGELGYMKAGQKELVIQFRASRGVMSNHVDPFQHIRAYIFHSREWIEKMECVEGLEQDPLCCTEVMCRQEGLVMRDARTGKKVSSGDIYKDREHAIQWDVTWVLEKDPAPLPAIEPPPPAPSVAVPQQEIPPFHGVPVPPAGAGRSCG